MVIALAYYMFVNFGTKPSDVAAMSDREKVLCWQMAKKEMESRKRK